MPAQKADVRACRIGAESPGVDHLPMIIDVCSQVRKNMDDKVFALVKKVCQRDRPQVALVSPARRMKVHSCRTPYDERIPAESRATRPSR
jgi:hypothetical protein